MALSLQDQNLVWQKVKQALTGASPVAQEAFLKLKVYLATQGGNPQLQYIPFGSADIVVNTGYSPIGGVTSTVFALYAKNDGTGDGTDAFVRLYNDTTNTDITKVFVSGVIQDDNDAFLAIKHNGWTFGTDLTISADTGAGTGTESAAANAAYGFVIVGA